jgi:hypothetical protein
MFAVRPTLIVFLLALLAVKIPARVIQPEEEIFNPTPVVRQARQQSTATLTILKTVRKMIHSIICFHSEIYWTFSTYWMKL